MEDAHAREVENVLSYFGTDVHSGLSDFEVSKASISQQMLCIPLQAWHQLHVLYVCPVHGTTVLL
jgi:hypothetical protein